MLCSIKRLASIAVLGATLSQGMIASAAFDCRVESDRIPTNATYRERCRMWQSPYTILSEFTTYTSGGTGYYLYLDKKAGSGASAFGFDANDNELCNIFKSSNGGISSGLCGPTLAYFVVYGSD